MTAEFNSARISAQAPHETRRPSGQTAAREETRRPLDSIFHTATAKILDFLIIYREFDYSEADIARKTHLTYKTVSTIIPQLLEERVIKFTGLHGRSNMYRINEESDKVKGLIKYVDFAIEQKMERYKDQ